jgi:hypothetical protein
MSQEITVAKKGNKKVIALAIICIILAASLVGVIAVYQPYNLQAQIAEKDTTINSLTRQIANLTEQLSKSLDPTTYAQQVAYMNQQIANLNTQIAYLNDTLISTYSDNAGYQKVVNLELSGTLYDDTFTQNANVTTTLTLTTNQLYYAGYILVEAQATANTTYAEILYSYGNYNFDYNQTLGVSGTAIFPVLSSPAEPSTVEIRIGNVNQTTTNSVSATITYYY